MGRFSDTLFGDFIQTDNFFRVFVVDTKTDNSKSGQWVTFTVSKSPTLQTTQHGLIRTVTYNEFLAEIKSACKSVNLDPQRFGTHSFRRGHVTDQFVDIPDQMMNFFCLLEIKCF